MVRAGRGGRRRIYWDSCVWLRYINEDPENKEVLDLLLRDSANRNGDIELITSAIAQTEVAYATVEQNNQALDDDIEQKIDSLWLDRRAVILVEYYPAIALEARGLIRMGVEEGLKIGSHDSIHLATAKRLQVSEFHTYDKKLLRFSNKFGFPITEPFIHGHPSSQQEMLPPAT